MNAQPFHKPEPEPPDENRQMKGLRWSLRISVLGWIVYGPFAYAFADVQIIPPFAQSLMVLIGSLLIGTHYTVDGNMLRVVSGPFRWKVPIDQIRSVQATRNPLSSPALSLDRLRIEYGKRRRIMVSPADKAGFLKAIGQELVDGK